MKPIPGKIIITDKVYFEPDGLEEPKEEDYFIGSSFHQAYFNGAMEEYEASKQLIKVEKVNYSPLSQTWIIEPFDFLDFALDPNQYVVTNNQPCKAEINGERATIIELL